MAVKMSLFWVSLIISVIGSHASGELSILHSPDSLKFSGSDIIYESLLKEIFSASLGLSVEENSNWNGLSITDPFNTPEAIVEVYVDGVSNLGNINLKRQQYPLAVDEYEPDTYDILEHRIKQRFNEGGNRLVNIQLSDINQLTAYPDVFGKIAAPKVHKQQTQHLKTSVVEDYEFLAELEALNTITAKVESGVISPDNVVDAYNFRFTSLHALSDLHGPHSGQTKEAKALLGEALERLSAAFEKAYEGSVLVTVVTTDIAHTRRTIRSVNVKTTLEAQSAEDSYSADYAAIFNIILWFSVVFAFALISIVYTIMDMDPGRDSIIYRMTNTRMKKDN